MTSRIKRRPGGLTIIENGEEALLLSELAPLLPGSPSYFTVRKWCLFGTRNRHGETVKMEAVILPSGMASSVEAYRRFIYSLNE